MKFYKIIRSSNVQKSNLKLPGKFEKRFGDKLPRHVTLVVPNGAEWRVEVEKSDDGAWLMGPGWAGFVDSLGLGHGHFLMFEFDELRAVFHVVVMGMNASEIKYPASAIDEDHPVDVTGDGDNDNADDVVLVTVTNQPVKNKGYRRADREIGLNDEGHIQYVVQGRKVYTSVVTEGTEQALARAKAFKATEPVFIIALQPSYLGRSCQLRVPLPFIVAFFDLAVNNVILEARGGRTWPMLYRMSGRNAHFTYGWKQFAEDNCLTTGDVCLFVLNRESQNALKVAIFRTNGDEEVPISHSHQ